MAETAVGLFDHRDTADAAVEALSATGIAPDAIRIVSKHGALPVAKVTSTPALDFAAALFQDLRSLGASELECEAYVDGVHRGHALVFATGTPAQADDAIAVMNGFHPIETEEFEGAVSALAGVHISEMGAHDIHAKIHSSRRRSEGARVFSW